jgi:hypothetical protein
MLTVFFIGAGLVPVAVIAWVFTWLAADAVTVATRAEPISVHVRPTWNRNDFSWLAVP